jgi:hypothetical protein
MDEMPENGRLLCFISGKLAMLTKCANETLSEGNRQGNIQEHISQNNNWIVFILILLEFTKAKLQFTLYVD